MLLTPHSSYGMGFKLAGEIYQGILWGRDRFYVSRSKQLSLKQVRKYSCPTFTLFQGEKTHLLLWSLR